MGFLSSIFAPGEQARGQKLDDQLRILNEQARAEGRISDAEFNERTARQQNSAASTYDQQIGAEFIAGAEEGLARTQAAFKDTVSGAAGFSLRAVFGFVPWWVWVAGALFLAFRLGLLDGMLKRK